MGKKKVAVVIALITLIAVSSMGILIYQRRHTPPLTLYGNVDIRTVNLAFRVGGRLAQLLVDEGDDIAPGQLLAKLDDAPLRNALLQARANVASAEAKRDLARAGYRREEIDQVRSQLTQLKAAYDYADSFYQRQRGAWARRAISADQLEDAAAAGKQAAANLQMAKDKLQQYLSGNRPQEIAAAEAEWAQAQAALMQADLNVKDTLLTSPSAGIILTRAQEAGSMLNVGDTVFTLSLTRPVWVRAYVGERYLTDAAPGAGMLILVDGRPDKAYHGKIGFVSPTAEFTPKNVETPELRTDLVYRLRIIVTDADDALRQGMPVTLQFAAGNHHTQDRGRLTPDGNAYGR